MGKLTAAKIGRLAILTVACVVFAAGCPETRREEPVRLTASPRVYEKDLPLPVGFYFVEDESEDRATGTSRLYLRHTYEGPASKHSVNNFYLEQMPLSRWVRVSNGNVKGRYTQRYEKGEESCTVVIRDREGLQRGSRVEIIISREERGKLPPVPQGEQ